MMGKINNVSVPQKRGLWLWSDYAQQPKILQEIPGKYTAVQSQKVVSAHFTGEQILPFGFDDQYSIVTCTVKNVSCWNSS